MHAEQQPDKPRASSFDSDASIDDETLVAYLDGELTQGEVNRVEAAIARDSSIQTRLDEMRRAWDLLEELPAPAPNPNFAQSTIEIVALTTTSPSIKLQEKLATYRKTAYLVLACAALFFVGILVVRAGQWSQERSTLRILPLLSDWESIKKIVETSGGNQRGADAEAVSDEAMSWLRKVAEVEDFPKVVGKNADDVSVSTPVPESIVERRVWISQLDGAGRDRLSANLEDFRTETSKEIQTAAVRLLEKIEADSDSVKLLEAARNYVKFLNSISSRERVTFSDKPQEERLIELQQRTNRKLVEVYCQTLPDADREAVKQWVQRLEQDPTLVLRSFGGATGVAADLNRRLFTGSSEIATSDFEQLQTSLSPEAQSVLGKLQDDERERWLIQYFIGSVEPIIGRQMRREFDRTALEAAFERQPPAIKGMLEFRAPLQVQEELGRPGGGRQGSRRREDFRPPPGQ
ncbi:MAG: hypothetical protein U0892_12640 [Pirellulales bacterium]